MKTTLFVCIAVLAPLAGAQELRPIDIKTGLWETTTKTDLSGMSMPAMPQIPPDRLAQMPPEARARIEAMMKGRGNVGGTTRSCITREMLDKGLNFNADKSCTYKVTSSSSSSQTIHSECTRGNTKTSGDITIDRVDSEHVKGNIDMKGMGQDGQGSVKVAFDTKFISSDCGDVKPPQVK